MQSFYIIITIKFLVPFYALWKSVLATGHCVCTCLEIWVLPKFPRRHFTEHNGVYPRQLYYNTWGHQEDDGDDDVKKLQKIIHHFFSWWKFCQYHTIRQRDFFLKSILFYFNLFINNPPPPTILSQSQNTKILGPPKFLTSTSKGTMAWTCAMFH